MKKKLTRCIAMILAIVSVFAFASCGKDEPRETTAQTTTAVQTTTAESTTEATVSETTPETSVTTSESAEETTSLELPEADTPSDVNHLTGEPLEEGQNPLFRPVAVTVNNLKVATKYQSGLSEADIIYEVEVEGGLTRLLAVFSDPAKAQRIGSVRSARPVMVCIVLGHDAYFAHAGGSTHAVDEIAAYGVSDLDGSKGYAGYFYYDDAVVKATSLEHGYFVNGDSLASAMDSHAESSGRTDIKTGYNNLFDFYTEPTALPGGQACTKVTTSYYGYKPCFTYSEETGKYGREQYGAPHVDYLTGEQLQFDNVIVLSVPSAVISGDTAGRRDFDDVGSGTGILASQGTYINIKWEKASYTSPLVLTTEDGTPLRVNTGKTFISYVNGESNFSVSAE